NRSYIALSGNGVTICMVWRKKVMMIGLSTILFIVIGIIIILTFVTFVRKSNKSTPPLMTSYVIFGLLLLNCLFFLMNGYTLLQKRWETCSLRPFGWCYV